LKICIVGAGISGLATAQALLSRKPDAEIIIFEAANRVGGKVWTEKSAEGYICEGGVNGFLDKIPRTLELCAQTGVSPVRADTSAQTRYIFSRNELHHLPEKPLEFLQSRLLTVPGRLRVLYDSLQVVLIIPTKPWPILQLEDSAVKPPTDSSTRWHLAYLPVMLQS